jgi:hypothetical protein
MPDPDLETVIRRAMSRFPWDTSSATIATDHIPSPVADEDHIHGTVIRADVSDALASVEDQMGFELDRLGGLNEDLQTRWERVADDLANRLGVNVSAELWENQMLVLLMA